MFFGGICTVTMDIILQTVLTCLDLQFLFPKCIRWKDDKPSIFVNYISFQTI